MLQFILAVALCAQVPEPPTDRQILAALPETAAVRTGVSITKTPPPPGGTVWTCITYYTEVRDGVETRRLHVNYLERAHNWNTPVAPVPGPLRR